MAENADALQGRLARASSPEEQVELLRKHFLRRARSKSVAWIDDVGTAAEEHGLDLPVVRAALSSLAWQAREVGQELPLAGAGSPDMAGNGLKRLCRLYVQGFRLRYDFKFLPLSVQVAKWLKAYPDDALLLAFAAFGGLGAQSPNALRAVTASLESPNSDHISRTVCLHGLWFGNHVENQAERIIHLSDELIANGEDGANLYFWRAYAFRRLERFDKAMESIDKAISLHPPGMNMIHQDYVRERALIATSKLILSQVEERARRVSTELGEQLDQQLESAKTELLKKQEDAQKVVSDSLLKIVEILGLFIALAGFLVGSGVVAFRAQGFWQNFASMGLILVGSALFFTLLRLVIHHRPKISRR